MKANSTEIRIVQGDITEEATEAIVNAANNLLEMGGGVAGVIRRKGGQTIQEECNRLGPIKIGEAAITGAGKLKARYVIHAATMGMDFQTDETKIRDATRNSLLRAEGKKITSIAFPALGCGVGGFPLEGAARIMTEETVSYLKTHPESCLKEIRFVLYTPADFKVFNQLVLTYLEYFQREKKL